MLKLRIKRRRVNRAKRDEALFKLTAQPEFKQDGPAKGFLDGVVFTAQSASSLYKWHTPNGGNFISDFNALVPMEKAIEVLHDLHSGRTVNLPGRYRAEQLQGKFGFDGRGKG